MAEKWRESARKLYCYQIYLFATFVLFQLQLQLPFPSSLVNQSKTIVDCVMGSNGIL